MIAYFESMIDPHSGRFFLFSYPQSPSCSDSSQAIAELRSHCHCPLRDIGSAWDAFKAIKARKCYYGKTTDGLVSASGYRLEDAILQTTGYYSSSLVTIDSDRNAMHLSQEVLKEPPNISHNALLLLALIGSEELNLFDAGEERSNLTDGLASGILSLQRPDGAFATQFCPPNDDVWSGIEFFPGQAMTALMAVYLHSSSSSRTRPGLVKEKTLQQILPAMIRAFGFYRVYYEEGKRQNTIDANFSIWQIQAFCRLLLGLRHQGRPASDSLASEVTEYCLALCEDILQSPAWKLLSRGKSFYPNLSTIEIACGLDALCQGYNVLLPLLLDQENSPMDDTLASSFRIKIERALDFLKWSQDQIPPDVLVGYGGLGHGGYYIREQRLDVTGHAIGAVANLVVPNE